MIFFLLACSAATDWAPITDSGYPDAEAASTIRVDVLPSSTSGFLPQSFTYRPNAWQDTALSMSLEGTVTLPGQITGEVTRGWGADAPSTLEPLSAVITAVDPNTISYGISQSSKDQNGTFSLSVPQGPGYFMAVIPEDVSTSPLWITEQTGMWNGQRLDVLLPVGSPIFGRVVDETGRGLSHAPMRIIAVDSPVSISADFSTDENGWYTVRVAAPGPWRIETVPGEVNGEDYILPALSTEITLEPEVQGENQEDSGDTASDIELGGTVANLDVGQLTSSRVFGKIVDPEGRFVAGARVVITSRSLEGANGTFVAEKTTDNEDGYFIVPALPGVYDIEVIPAYDTQLSPTRSVVTISSSDTDIGNIKLTPISSLEGWVQANTNAQENTVVTATQDDFGGYVYTTTTDSGGHFKLSVPEGSYTLSLTPADPASWAITTVSQNSGTSQVFSLAEGAVVQGTVLQSVLSENGGEENATGISVIEIHSVVDNRLLARGLTDTTGNFLVKIDVQDIETEDSAPPEDSAADSGTDTGSDTGTDTSGSDSGNNSGNTQDSGAQ